MQFRLLLFVCSIYSLSCCCLFVFFFFKQKTAYEMRISDWSSDVCSSDLKLAGEELVGLTPPQIWRRGVGRTFQITATFASMTVVENVAMVLMSERRELFSFTRRAVGRQDRKSTRLNSSH